MLANLTGNASSYSNNSALGQLITGAGSLLGGSGGTTTGWGANGGGSALTIPNDGF